MQGELKEKRGKFNLPRDGSSLWVGKTKAFWNNKPGVITLRGARRGETRIERALPPLQTSGCQFRRPRYAFESRFNAIEDTIEWKSWFLNRLERGKKTSLLESSLERRNFSKCQSWRGGSSIRERVKMNHRVFALLPVGRKKWKFEYDIYVKGNRRRIWNANGIERERDGQTFSQKC